MQRSGGRKRLGVSEEAAGRQRARAGGGPRGDRRDVNGGGCAVWGVGPYRSGRGGVGGAGWVALRSIRPSPPSLERFPHACDSGFAQRVPKFSDRC